MANKDRASHLDMLVYQFQGTPYSTSYTPTKNDKENFANAMASQILLDRLNVKG
jgi:hypothetical protein